MCNVQNIHKVVENATWCCKVMQAPVDPDMCFRKGSVQDAFERQNEPVRGTSDVDSLPNIGSYLKAKLNAAHIVSINDFLLRSMPHNTQLKLEKFISDLVPNRRAHTCVVDTSSGKQRYHVSDVNTCGYNTLLKVVQFAHQHVNNFHNFGFVQAFPCAFSLAMPMRHRGKTKGSRHCLCHQSNQSCQVDGHGECRWHNNTCLPRGGGGQDAGFRGVVVAQNNALQVRNQRIPAAHNNNNYLGRPYKLGWMVFPGGAQGRGRGAQGRGAQGRGRGAQGRGAGQVAQPNVGQVDQNDMQAQAQQVQAQPQQDQAQQAQAQQDQAQQAQAQVQAQPAQAQAQAQHVQQAQPNVALRQSNRVRRPNSRYLQDDYLLGGDWIKMSDFDDLLERQEERSNRKLHLVRSFRRFLLAS